MGEIRSLVLFVLIALMAISLPQASGQDHGQDQKPEVPQPTVSDLNKLSVHDLVGMLDTAAHGWWDDDVIHHEALLTELLKRKEMEVGELLSAKLEQNKIQLAEAKKLLQELQQDDSKEDEYYEQF